MKNKRHFFHFYHPYQEDFFSDQCKEIEEKNRMGKIRDLFKKIKDTKGIFHAKIDTIRNKNSKGLTEAEEFIYRVRHMKCWAG